MKTIISPKAAKLTKLFIWVCFTIIVAVDIYWAANGTLGDTISEVTKYYSYQWLTIPVAHGVLTGHLFWPIRGPITHKWGRIACLWMLTLAVIVLDIVSYVDVFPVIPNVIAIGLGRLLWPQSVPEGTLIYRWTKK
jgi:hypothetical protein